MKENPVETYIEEMRTIIRGYPPEFRYPIVLGLSQLVVEEMPPARDAYAKRMAELQGYFKKLVNHLYSDECGEDE